jgi:hypothetical protein
MPKKTDSKDNKVVEPQKVKLVQDKVCKNSVRYANKTEGAATSSIYLNKGAYEALGSPTEITITVEAG